MLENRQQRLRSRELQHQPFHATRVELTWFVPPTQGGPSTARANEPLDESDRGHIDVSHPVTDASQPSIKQHTQQTEECSR